MTCRHGPGDPNCSSNPNGYAAMENARREKERQVEELKKIQDDIYARTPDREKFEIVDMQRVGPHVVLKVLYPNCAKCAYEGNKVMVFLNVTEGDIVRWRIIDPHFRNPSQARSPKEAPPPAARFPASKDGWADAVAYARGKEPGDN